jgi:hypothetical protein
MMYGMKWNLFQVPIILPEQKSDPMRTKSNASYILGKNEKFETCKLSEPVAVDAEHDYTMVNAHKDEFLAMLYIQFALRPDKPEAATERIVLGAEEFELFHDKETAWAFCKTTETIN